MTLGELSRMGGETVANNTMSTASAVQQTANLAYADRMTTEGRALAKDAAPVAKVASVRLSGVLAGREAQQTVPVSEKGSIPGVINESPEIALEQVREHVRRVVPELDFSVDEDTGRVVVKLMDTATNEVLRQIPSEEVLHIAKMLDKLQGLLLREKA